MDTNDNANDLTNEPDIDSSPSTDNTVASLSSTKHVNTYNNNKHVNILQQSFSSDYTGPVIVLIESLIENTNLGSWHPIRAAQFFSMNFTGINIKPAGSKKNQNHV